MQTDRQTDDIFVRTILLQPALGQPALVSVREEAAATFTAIIAVEKADSSASDPASLRERFKDAFWLSAIGDNENMSDNEKICRLSVRSVEPLDSDGLESKWHLVSTRCLSVQVEFFGVKLAVDEAQSMIPQDSQFELFDLHFGEPSIPRSGEQGRPYLGQHQWEYFRMNNCDNFCEGNCLYSGKEDQRPFFRRQCKPHAVCLTRRKWEDFSFIHASDLHIAKRNDDIPDKAQISGSETGYINFNHHLQDLIVEANKMAADGELDFIVLTGDLIDFVEWTLKSGDVQGLDNWFTFFEILTGANGKSTPLRVPVFTVMGNHDYRRYHYNLDDGGKRWEHDFGLSRNQFKRYDEHEKKIKFPEQLDAGLSYIRSYFLNINPDLDYAVPLGNHKIICMDTGKDEFDATDAKRMLDEAKGDTDKLLHSLIKRGLKISSLILPAIPSVLRWALPALVVGFALGFIFSGRIWPGVIVGGIYGLLVCAVRMFLFFRSALKGLGSPLRHHVHQISSALEGVIGSGPDSEGFLQKQLDWSCKQLEQVHGMRIMAMHSPPVNVQPDVDLGSYRESVRKDSRDPYISIREVDLSAASIHQNWSEFLDILVGIHGNSPVDIVLCGHTHRNLEFRLETYYWDEGSNPSRFKRKVGFYTDKYTEQLNGFHQDVKKCSDWWQKHTPLITQTASLGPYGKKEKLPLYRVIQVRKDVITQIKTSYIPKRS